MTSVQSATRCVPAGGVTLSGKNGNSIVNFNGGTTTMAGDLRVEAGAELGTNAANGRIFLFAPKVSNQGVISAADGQVAHVCMGPTMDLQIVRELFTNTIEAATLLGVDAPFRAQLATALPKLAPMQIGKHGQLQEWLEDFDEVEPHHRHVSHLYGLWPGDQITPLGTPVRAV